MGLGWVIKSPKKSGTKKNSPRIKFSGQTCNRAGLLHNGKRAERRKMGKKWENRGKFAPIENGGKMAEKYRKNGKSGLIFHFVGIFRPFFPHFRSGQIFHDFPIFSPFFVVRPVFHCVAGPHDCKARHPADVLGSFVRKSWLRAGSRNLLGTFY